MIPIEALDSIKLKNRLSCFFLSQSDIGSLKCGVVMMLREKRISYIMTMGNTQYLLVFNVKRDSINTTQIEYNTLLE